jgi:hypothetical protein
MAMASQISLPWTKTTGYKGAHIYLMRQFQPLDPTEAIISHFSSSRLPVDALIAEFVEDGLVKVMDKEIFMAMCNTIWSKEGHPRITGHSFRIGGTTALLRSGINIQVVKKMGRWSSDAYLRYWRNVQELFADHATNVHWVDFVV